MTTVELDQETQRPWYRLSLSSGILLGMLLGIMTGIFFGEMVGFLQVIGDGFIMLLQMTILPYITVSLIAGIGGLTYQKARTLAARAGLILLLFWAVTFVVILAVPLSFPSWESGSFFSTSLVEAPAPVDFLSIYIPANPFRSLAENLVPAVVLFSIMLGIALIGIDGKEAFVSDLHILSEALVRVTGFVVKLTPIGVFAIAAAAAGTMTVDEISRLQVYLIAFTVAALILAFWVLPMMVALATPFRYRDIVGVSRDALLTAFTTGNLFVVLAVLTENGKRLFRDYGIDKGDTDAYVDIIIPVSFNFPNAGKLIMLVFILFAVWFVGGELSLGEYPQFVVSGLLSFFGGVDVALPFMLAQMRLPSDLYQLYVVSGILNGRTATLLAAMNLLTFTLLSTAALTGQVTLQWRKLFLFCLGSLALLAVSVAGMRFYFTAAVENAFAKESVIDQMDSPLFGNTNVVHESVPETLVRGDPALGSLLDRILDRGVLRVGYAKNSLPYSFINADGKLVGFDVDMAQLLAADLGVVAEFIPVDLAHLAEQLKEVPVDIVMAGVTITPDRLEDVVFSEPYMDVSAALIVPDYRRKEFAKLDDIHQLRGLRVAVFQTGSDYFKEEVQRAWPNLDVVSLDSTVDFFFGGDEQADIMVHSAEAGSAWTLRFPDYTVVVPEGMSIKWPVAYPIAEGDTDLARYVSRWLNIALGDSRFRELYNHWVLGLTAKPETPRWSVIRNVLHWVN